MYCTLLVQVLGGEKKMQGTRVVDVWAEVAALSSGRKMPGQQSGQKLSETVDFD